MNQHIIGISSILFILIGLPIIFFLHKLFGCPKKGENKYFRDKYGRILFYRGTNVCNASKWAPDYLPWHTKADYEKLKKHGFNLVRFVMFWGAIEPKEDKYDAKYLNKVREHIDMLGSLDISVILDLHQDLYSRRYTGNGFPDWALPPKQYPFKPDKKWFHNYFKKAVLESYKHFWKSNHLKYKYIKMIMFVHTIFNDASNVIGIDVMNEPFPNSPFLFLFEKKTLAELYRNIDFEIDSLNRGGKGKGHTLPLFVEPGIWTSTGIPSYLTEDWRPDQKYIPHYYPPFSHNRGTYGWFSKLLMGIAIRSKAREAQIVKSPFIIGEFGICNVVKNRFSCIRDFITLANKHHLNWIWWSFDKETHSAQGLMDNDGNPNEVMKALTHAYPQKIAGINPVFESKNNSFLLEFTDDIGYKVPTEIYVPGKVRSVETSNLTCDYDHKATWQVMKFYSNEKGKHRISITWQSTWPLP